MTEKVLADIAAGVLYVIAKHAAACADELAGLTGIATEPDENPIWGGQS